MIIYGLKLSCQIFGHPFHTAPIQWPDFTKHKRRQILSYGLHLELINYHNKTECHKGNVMTTFISNTFMFVQQYVALDPDYGENGITLSCLDGEVIISPVFLSIYLHVFKLLII